MSKSINWQVAAALAALIFCSQAAFAEVFLSLKEQVLLKEPIVFLRDIASCYGEEDACQRLEQVEIYRLPEDRRQIVLRREEIKKTVDLKYHDQKNTIVFDGADDITVVLDKSLLLIEQIQAVLVTFLSGKNQPNYKLAIRDLKLLQPVYVFNDDITIHVPKLFAGLWQEQSLNTDFVNKQIVLDFTVDYENPVLTPSKGLISLFIEAQEEMWIAAYDVSANALVDQRQFSKTWRKLAVGAYKGDFLDVKDKVLKNPLTKGQVLLASNFLLPFRISYGEKVEVYNELPGIIIKTMGVAMERGRIGDVIKVKLPNKMVVTGKLLGNKSVALQ